MGSVTVVTPPTEYPVSLASAKSMLLVDHSADDALITAPVAAATAEAQEQASRSMVTCRRCAWRWTAGRPMTG